MNKLPFSLLLILLVSCQSHSQDKKTSQSIEDSIKNSKQTSPKLDEYLSNYKEDSNSSRSIGSVSNGSLENGKLMSFKGPNFSYFDTTSYVQNRAFLNDKVKKSVLETYAVLNIEVPNRHFTIMECSNKHGGKIFPHRTHQNGLSIDFMVPLIKNNQAYYHLDTLGGQHYLLDFDEKGRYSEDKNVSIDFDLIAKHLLILNEQVSKNKLKINKVILKIELKDELFASKYGQELQKSGIYFAQSLTPMINSLHDDHYHIDFEEIK